MAGEGDLPRIPSDTPRVPLDFFERVMRSFDVDVFEERGTHYAQRGMLCYPFRPKDGWVSGSQVRFACEVVGIDMVEFYLAVAEAIKEP